MRRGRHRDAALTAFFLIAICAPALVRLSGHEAVGLGENRRLAAPPTTLGQLRAWWNDHFGLRPTLIRAYGGLKLHLGVSPSPDVLLGSDGWLFFAGEGSVLYHRNAMPFDEAQLAGWRALLQARHDWLAARGVRYLVVFAPSKETIYPEHYPARFGQERPDSRLDQLLAHLRARATVEVLDLRPRLREERRLGEVFFHTDTHWNRRGAAAALDEIVTRLAGWFPGLVAPRGLEETLLSSCCDLATMLGVAHPPAEPGVVRRPPARPLLHLWLPGPNAARPRALFLHDSFLNPIRFALGEVFSSTTFIREPLIFDRAAVAAEKPDVVVQEMVERLLTRPVPVDPPEGR